MFVRDKRIGPYTYVYLVENVREAGRTKQRIIANLGRKEMVVARGDLDRLARSVARLAQRSMVLSLVEGEAPPNAACRRIGPALLFERLWQEVGCRAVLTALAGQRQFAFAAERAVFLTVLHRLFVSGSDRAADKWRADYRIDGSEGLQLHHLYRAMAWLGEPLADQTGAGRLAPRVPQGSRRGGAVRPPARPVCRTQRRLHGHHQPVLRGPGRRETRPPRPLQRLPARSQPDDRRPGHGSGRPAAVLRAVARQHRRRDHPAAGGRPVARALWRRPRLRRRRSRHDQCRDHCRPRGTQARIHPRRARAQQRRGAHHGDRRSGAVCAAGRAAGSGVFTELEAKQVKIGDRRYIVCRNLAEARRDAEQRAAILDGLRAKLAQGDKALVGNSGFRRYLKTPAAEHFAIDEARVAEDARFDGLYVLRTNTKLTPLQAMLRYRDLLRVEQLLRQAKAVLATRPIYHSSDMAIRGHVFCSFLALLLAKELEDRLRRQALPPNGATSCAISTGCRRSTLEQDGKRFLLRTPTTGVAGKLFQAVGIALPPNVQELPRQSPPPAA